MPEKIGYYLDEHIPAAVSVGLAVRGINTLTTQEAGRSGSSDSEQLKFALENERVIVTFDSDFLEMATQEAHHAGIVWCPATKYSIGELIRALVLVHLVLDRSDMRDHIEYL